MRSATSTPCGVGDLRLLGRVVHRGGDAVHAVELLLDAGRAGGAGHPADGELDLGTGSRTGATVLVMLGSRGRAGPYGASMSWRYGPAGDVACRGVPYRVPEGVRPGRRARSPASSTAARTASSSSGAAETTVTSPVAATALTEVTPASGGDLAGHGALAVPAGHAGHLVDGGDGIWVSVWAVMSLLLVGACGVRVTHLDIHLIPPRGMNPREVRVGGDASGSPGRGPWGGDGRCGGGENPSYPGNAMLAGTR